MYSESDDLLDTGFFSNTADEIRSKLVSRQNIYEHYGEENVNFDETDTMTNCKEINERILEWAL